MIISKNIFSSVELILFDLGGVILNINYQKTAEEFQKIGITNFDDLYSQAKQSGIFDELEMGKISGQFFINHLMNYCPSGTSPNQIVAAWNAMLLDLPKENIQLLEQLRRIKRIALFSNTNEIHLAEFNRKLHEVHQLEHLDSLFEKTFYSHIFQFRKPNPDGFLEICKQMSVSPSQMLFIDDSIQHVESAQSLGIQTCFIDKKVLLKELFREVIQ